MRGAVLAVCALVAGCGKILGIGDLSGPAAPVADGATPVDAASFDAVVDAAAAPDAMADASEGVPAMITVSGDAVVIGGSSICANCPIELRRGNQPVATSTTDPLGKFQLTAPTGGVPLDVSVYMPPLAGSLAASSTYFPAPLRANRSTSITLYGDPEIARLETLANVPAALVQVIIVVHVRGADGYEVAGAKVSLLEQPQVPIHYGDGANDPLPQGLATMTSGDGVAYIFAAAPMASTVQADKPGASFVSRPLALPPQTVVFVDLAP